MALPPGVSQQDFNRALQRFRSAVGNDWVFTSDADIALYRDAYSPYWGEAEERVASGAVAPATVEEVQAVVRAANEFKVPIYPISTGRNLAYGGSAPNYSGSVVLDLKRMNRVLEVDESRAFALVEPGVSYFDLYNHIEERGLALWIDPPDPGWGSVIGNALDGGGGWSASPFRDHFGSHCGMEVVTAEGDIMRTGMGAVPGAQTWQENKWGFGPWVDGLFRQSNMGVVTKMGFYLMPRPEAYISGTATVPRDEDVIPLMDTFNLLESQHVVNGSTQLGAAGGFGAGRGDGPGGGWTCQVPIYGPANVVRAQLDYCRAKFEAIPGCTFAETDLIRVPLSEADLASVRLVNFGIPNLSTFSIIGRSQFNPNPAGGHIDFSPIVSRQGSEVLRFRNFYQQTMQDLTGGENLGVQGPLFMTNWERTMVALSMFPISKNPDENRRIRRVFEQMVERMGEQGWAEYRAPAVFQDNVSDTYGYNDNALRRFREKIKDAVDPNGIISAGRYGVWPKHLRDV
jgi:4-cresol dehydrogenase (hydroxylating)